MVNVALSLSLWRVSGVKIGRFLLGGDRPWLLPNLNVQNISTQAESLSTVHWLAPWLQQQVISWQMDLLLSAIGLQIHVIGLSLCFTVICGA